MCSSDLALGKKKVFDLIWEFKVSAGEMVVTYGKKGLETQDMSHITLGFVFLAKCLVLNSGNYKVAQKNLGQGSNKVRVENFGGWKQQDKLEDNFNNAQEAMIDPCQM